VSNYFLEGLGEKRNVSFLNYFPFFIKIDNSENDNISILENFFIKGDVHWDEQGHKLIADTFLEFYRNNMR